MHKFFCFLKMDIDWPIQPDSGIDIDWNNVGKRAYEFGKGLYRAYNRPTKKKKLNFSARKNLSKAEKAKWAGKPYTPNVRKRMKWTRTKYNGRRTYRTTGYGGGKSRSRLRKKAVGKYYTTGCVEHIERGGVMSDSQCIYLGCTNSPMEKVLENISRCIIKELFKQAGIAIVDWSLGPDDLLTDTGFKISHTYYETSDSADPQVAPVSQNILGTSTYSGIVTQFVTLLRTLYGVGVPSYPINFTMNSRTINPTLEGAIVATVVCDQFSFKMANSSCLLIQNRTLAEGTDNNIDENITNNPITGFVYQTKTNGFIPRQRGSVTAAGGFLPDQITGIVNRPHGIDERNLIKPPKPHYFRGVVRAAAISLKPGEIKKHSIYYAKQYNLSTFLVKHNTALTSTKKQTFLGTSMLFAMEKLLDARNETSPINIGYEVNTNLKFTYKYTKKIMTQPLRLVDLTPIAEQV